MEGYTQSADNYPEVIRVLKERFGDPSKLVEVYYKELEELSPSDCAEDQRSNLDAISKILTNLTNLGTHIDQGYLKGLIKKKFSQVTLRWALKSLVDSEQDYDIDILMKSLSSAVRLNEEADLYAPSGGATKSSKETKTATAAVLVGGSPKGKTNGN